MGFGVRPCKVKVSMKFQITIREFALLVVIAALAANNYGLRGSVSELKVYRGRFLLLQHHFEDDGLRFRWGETGFSYDCDEEDGLLVISPRGSIHSHSSLELMTEASLTEEFERPFQR